MTRHSLCYANQEIYVLEKRKCGLNRSFIALTTGRTTQHHTRLSALAPTTNRKTAPSTYGPQLITMKKKLQLKKEILDCRTFAFSCESKVQKNCGEIVTLNITTDENYNAHTHKRLIHVDKYSSVHICMQL